MQLINSGYPVTMWNGISAERLRNRATSKFCTAKQKHDMDYAALLMEAKQPITLEEFGLAEKALKAVEKKMLDDVVAPVVNDYAAANPSKEIDYWAIAWKVTKFIFSIAWKTFLVLCAILVIVTNVKE